MTSTERSNSSRNFEKNNPLEKLSNMQWMRNLQSSHNDDSGLSASASNNAIRERKYPNVKKSDNQSFQKSDFSQKDNKSQDDYHKRNMFENKQLRSYDSNYQQKQYDYSSKQKESWNSNKQSIDKTHSNSWDPIKNSGGRHNSGEFNRYSNRKDYWNSNRNVNEKNNAGCSSKSNSFKNNSDQSSSNRHSGNNSNRDNLNEENIQNMTNTRNMSQNQRIRFNRNNNNIFSSSNVQNDSFDNNRAQNQDFKNKRYNTNDSQNDSKNNVNYNKRQFNRKMPHDINSAKFQSESYCVNKSANFSSSETSNLQNESWDLDEDKCDNNAYNNSNDTKENSQTFQNTAKQAPGNDCIVYNSSKQLNAHNNENPDKNKYIDDPDLSKIVKNDLIETLDQLDLNRVSNINREKEKAELDFVLNQLDMHRVNLQQMKSAANSCNMEVNTNQLILEQYSQNRETPVEMYQNFHVTQTVPSNEMIESMHTVYQPKFKPTTNTFHHNLPTSNKEIFDMLNEPANNENNTIDENLQYLEQLKQPAIVPPETCLTQISYPGQSGNTVSSNGNSLANHSVCNISKVQCEEPPMYSKSRLWKEPMNQNNSREHNKLRNEVNVLTPKIVPKQNITEIVSTQNSYEPSCGKQLVINVTDSYLTDQLTNTDRSYCQSDNANINKNIRAMTPNSFILNVASNDKSMLTNTVHFQDQPVLPTLYNSIDNRKIISNAENDTALSLYNVNVQNEQQKKVTDTTHYVMQRTNPEFVAPYGPGTATAIINKKMVADHKSELTISDVILMEHERNLSNSMMFRAQNSTQEYVAQTTAPELSLSYRRVPSDRPEILYDSQGIALKDRNMTCPVSYNDQNAISKFDNAVCNSVIKQEMQINNSTAPYQTTPNTINAYIAQNIQQTKLNLPFNIVTDNNIVNDCDRKLVINSSNLYAVPISQSDSAIYLRDQKVTVIPGMPCDNSNTIYTTIPNEQYLANTLYSNNQNLTSKLDRIQCDAEVSANSMLYNNEQRQQMLSERAYNEKRQFNQQSVIIGTPAHSNSLSANSNQIVLNEQVPMEFTRFDGHNLSSNPKSCLQSIESEGCERYIPMQDYEIRQVVSQQPNYSDLIVKSDQELHKYEDHAVPIQFIQFEKNVRNNDLYQLNDISKREITHYETQQRPNLHECSIQNPLYYIQCQNQNLATINQLDSTEYGVVGSTTNQSSDSVFVNNDYSTRGTMQHTEENAWYGNQCDSTNFNRRANYQHPKKNGYSSTKSVRGAYRNKHDKQNANDRGHYQEQKQQINDGQYDPGSLSQINQNSDNGTVNVPFQNQKSNHCYSFPRASQTLYRNQEYNDIENASGININRNKYRKNFNRSPQMNQEHQQNSRNQRQTLQNRYTNPVPGITSHNNKERQNYPVNMPYKDKNQYQKGNYNHTIHTSSSSKSSHSLPVCTSENVYNSNKQQKKQYLDQQKDFSNFCDYETTVEYSTPELPSTTNRVDNVVPNVDESYYNDEQASSYRDEIITVNDKSVPVPMPPQESYNTSINSSSYPNDIVPLDNIGEITEIDADTLNIIENDRKSLQPIQFRNQNLRIKQLNPENDKQLWIDINNEFKAENTTTAEPLMWSEECDEHVLQVTRNTPIVQSSLDPTVKSFNPIGSSRRIDDTFTKRFDFDDDSDEECVTINVKDGADFNLEKLRAGIPTKKSSSKGKPHRSQPAKETIATPEPHLTSILKKSYDTSYAEENVEFASPDSTTAPTESKSDRETTIERKRVTFSSSETEVKFID